MASNSPLVQACIVQVQADGVANNVPAIEAITKSVLKAVAASALISGADQTVINAQLTLALTDSD